PPACRSSDPSSNPPSWPSASAPTRRGGSSRPWNLPEPGGLASDPQNSPSNPLTLPFPAARSALQSCNTRGYGSEELDPYREQRDRRASLPERYRLPLPPRQSAAPHAAGDRLPGGPHARQAKLRDLGREAGRSGEGLHPGRARRGGDLGAPRLSAGGL